jgi:hypothetical protein
VPGHREPVLQATGYVDEGSTKLALQLLDEPMTQTAPYVHYRPGG